MKIVLHPLAAALSLSANAAASELGPVPTLGPLTSAQVRAAGAGGTGCSWMARRSGPVLFAMAGDRAVASVAGVLTVLSPDPGAKDLFPFTHDRWRTPAGQASIVVRKVAADRRTGTETLENATDLTLIQRGKRTLLHGTMQCGS